MQPDAVVLLLKDEILQSHLDEVPDLRDSVHCFVNLDFGLFKKVGVFEVVQEHVLRDSPDAGAAVQGLVIAGDVVLRLTDHLDGCLDVAGVHVLVPAEHPVDRGRLFVPILDDFVTNHHL